jgi:pilus assembly protein CpaB
MKKFSNWILIVASVLLATIAAFGSHFYLSRREAEIKQALVGNTEQIAVVVPRADLQAGEPVHMDAVASRPMPKDLVPAGAITPEEFGAFEGLVTKQPLPKGTPLLKHLLIGANSEDAFSTLLKKGQRALTFPVDDKTSTSHLLRPGDVVDVILIPKSEGSDDGKSSAASFGVIKQQARVLATGAKTVVDQSSFVANQDSSGLGNDYQTVTLAIETKEVPLFMEALRYVEGGRATVNFLLRNPLDEARMHLQSRISGAIQAFSGGDASHGELNGVLTQALDTTNTSGGDVTSNIQVFQKYTGEQSNNNEAITTTKP